MKQLVPLHALVKDTRQQQYALTQDPSSNLGGGGGGARPMRGRRYGESAEATTAANAKAKVATGSAKSSEALKRIESAVGANAIFARLNEMQLHQLQKAMMEHHVEAGSNVITQAAFATSANYLS